MRQHASGEGARLEPVLHQNARRGSRRARPERQMTWISWSRGSSPKTCPQLVQRDVDHARHMLNGKLCRMAHVQPAQPRRI